MILNEISTGTRTFIESELKKLGVELFTILDNGTVDVHQSLVIQGAHDKKLTIKFNVIEGNFNISNSRLKTLDGCPITVKGDFYVEHCHDLMSLVGSPTTIEGRATFHDCSSLLSMLHCPKITNKGLVLSHLSALKNLNGCPTEITGPFVVFACGNSSSSPTFLDGCPSKVGGILKLEDLKHIERFNKLPDQIDGKCIIHNCYKVKNFLALLKIKGTRGTPAAISITVDEHLKSELITCSKIETILNKYVKSRDVMSAQEELIEAGLEKYARL
jgi:hypothetical protein